ncbi:hypothetical protein F5Y13DRAFT_186462 [Hypoxylon sp. FL1857]|nr:hypothetical protein F5Y13DRAFT_186462 [Hypoxylon sp. FL1857]
MRASTSIGALALLCRGAFAQCGDSLAVLAGNQEVADQCTSRVSSDASALCSSFLGTSTSFVAVGTPGPNAAVTTTTELTTRTVTRVVFTTTTTTETEVVTSTTSTTVVASASPGPIGRRDLEINVLYPTPETTPSVPRSVSSATICPTLTSLPADSVSSSAISSACSCLGVDPVVSTVSTDAVVNIVTESETTVTTTTVTSTIVTFTKSTTTTTVAMETQTAAYDRCSVGYSSGGNGQGNRPENVQATSSRDCCQQCQQRKNCVASAYTGTTCQHLIKVSQLSGAKTSDQCPLGVEDYQFGAVGGMVYPGPCGY